MTVQRIGGTGVALYLTPEDLEDHGGDRETLDVSWTTDVIRQYLNRGGVRMEGKLEIEAFPCDSGVLLLASVCPPEPVFLGFPDFESVLCAARGRPEPTGRLFYADGQYILTLPEGPAARAMKELGVWLERPSGFEAWLREHGRVILPDGALAHLAGIFP